VNTVVWCISNRVTARGITPPPSGEVICQSPRGYSSEEIENRGGRVEKHRIGYAGASAARTAVLGGEFSRVTRSICGVRSNPNKDGNSGSWSEDNSEYRLWVQSNQIHDGQGIMDESYCTLP